MRTISALLLAGFLLLAACTPEMPASAPTERSPDPKVDEPFVRSCSSAVFGGDLRPNWRQHAELAGPVALVGVAAVRNAPDRWFGPRDGRYRALKVLVVVERGPSVTLIASPFDDQPVMLLYDELMWRNDNWYLLSEGDRAVTFQPCEGRAETQFNGYLVVRGPRCVNLEVWVDGEGQARALQVPFGRKASC